MPADTFGKASPSSVAATPASVNGTPDKPRTASEHRKSSKPIMEKRRRARINDSLGQLKTLILEALKKDTSRNSKLEKADILEMTVKHLRNIQRLQMTAAVNLDPSLMGKYRAGFSECIGEVTHFLSTCEGVNAEVRTRLLSHLAGCVSQINPVNYATQRLIPTYPPQPALSQAIAHIPSATPQLNGMPCKSVSPVSIHPEAFKLYSGLQIVPATTDGHFAFLIPGAALASLNAQSGHPALAVAMSPGAPSVTLDSVWRPW
ncbi:transcription factor HES-1-B-like [Osmerus mordax]|uniref:transcription factor HES-1-B-like n=1 Tax=Osmerus mordax TaxID=8014 RepID=UPI00350F5BE2